jgi:hypothetical protein
VEAAGVEVGVGVNKAVGVESSALESGPTSSTVEASRAFLCKAATFAGADFNQGIDKVRWSPSVLTKAPKEYYTLQSDVVFLPFHSFAAHNVGHILWDDFLPI